MIFEQIPLGMMQNFIYIIGDEETKEAAVVDPGWDVNKILKIAQKHDLNIKIILVTHTDFDHIQALKEIVIATDATVYVHKEELDAIKKLNINKIKTVEEGTEINIGKIKVKVLHTPGHTPGSVCYLLENKLISGDTLFVEACGRIDRPEGNTKNMFNSLQRLKKLDETLEVYPGHDYGSMQHSTIKHEKENNPFMKFESFDEFSDIR